MNFGRLKGKLVKITFFDHSIDDYGDDKIEHEPILCEAFGIVHSQSSKLLLLQTWRLVNGTKEDKENNKEVVKILRSCVQDVKVYTE